MPEEKKRKVIITDPNVKAAVAPTKEERFQEVEKKLQTIQEKVKTGNVTPAELDLFNYAVQKQKEFESKITALQATADDYTSKVFSLFDKDVSTLQNPKKLMSFYGSVVTDPAYQRLYSAENAFLPAFQKEQAGPELMFQKFQENLDRFTGTNKAELNKVNDYVKAGDYQSLEKLANSLIPKGDLFPTAITNTAKKEASAASAYLKQLALPFKALDKLKKYSQYVDPKDPINSVLKQPYLVKELGRELYAEEVGSELYGSDASFFHALETKSNPDNSIDYKASQFAISALKNASFLDYNKKLAEFSRLKLYAEKVKDPKMLEDANKGLQELAESNQLIDKFDVDGFLKQNFRETYLKEKAYQEKTKQYLGDTKTNTAAFLLGTTTLNPLMMLMGLPEKALMSLSNAGKTIINNLGDMGAGTLGFLGWEGLVGAQSPEHLAVIRNLNKFDKTYYPIGLDQEGKVVPSTEFHWVGADGKHHLNGYALIETGVPVAFDMAATIFIGKGIGGLGGSLGRLLGAAGSRVLGAERLALTGEALLNTPGIGTAGKLLTDRLAQNSLNTFASVYLNTYPRNLMQEYSNFKNSKDAEDVAHFRTLVEALSESIVPNTPDLFSKGAESIFSLGKKSFARDVSAGLEQVVLGIAPGISNKLLNRIVNSTVSKRALGMAGDIFQEGVIEEEASLVGNYFVDRLAHNRNKEYQGENELTLENILNTAIEATAGMALTAPLMGKGTKRAQKEEILAARWNIANNPEKFKAYFATLVEKGEMTKEEAIQKIAQVDKYAQALKTLPRDIRSIRDMRTLLENKDAQFEYFSRHLEKEELLSYVPKEGEIEQYTKELETIDKTLAKYENMADQYESLSVQDKKNIISNLYKDRLNTLLNAEDVSPQALDLARIRAMQDLKENKHRLFSSELEGYIQAVENAKGVVADKFKSFIENNNEGLTAEQAEYKTSLVLAHQDQYSKEELEEMLSAVKAGQVIALQDVFSITDEARFIEALAKNYVTAKIKERPLTTNGELLIPMIRQKYVEDTLFDPFVKGLSEEEASTKKEQLKEKFWNRVEELKQGTSEQQIFPEVTLTPTTEEEVLEVKEAEPVARYSPIVKRYTDAVNKGFTDDLIDLEEEALDILTEESDVKGLIEALGSIQKLFIRTDFAPIAKELSEGKADKLTTFLQQNGISSKKIETLISKVLPSVQLPSVKDRPVLAADVFTDDVVATPETVSSPTQQTLSEEDKTVEQASAKKPDTDAKEKRVFLEKNIGKTVVINGIKGVLNQINKFRYEVERGEQVFEFTLDDITSFYTEEDLTEQTLPAELQSPYRVSGYKVVEGNEVVVINDISYTINTNALGTVVSLTPENNPSQQIKNEKLLVAAEIERNKHEFKNTSTKEIQELIEELKNNYTDVHKLLETIWSYNMTESIAESLDKLYNNSPLSSNEALQTALWLTDVFDRISKLFDSKNTPEETQALLKAYDTANIINELLYNSKINKDETTKNGRETTVHVRTEASQRKAEVTKGKISKPKRQPKAVKETTQLEFELLETSPIVEAPSIEIIDTSTLTPEELAETVEPLKSQPEVENLNDQTKLQEQVERTIAQKDARENLVFLGISDMDYQDESRIYDPNIEFVFAFIDSIEEHAAVQDSAIIRGLGYHYLMHSGREVLNRAGIFVEPKESYEEFKAQFVVNNIPVLTEKQIQSLFKNPNALDTIKLGVVTNAEGKILLFDKFGYLSEIGTPIITAIGQTYEAEVGKGGKTLDEQFKATIPDSGIIAPLSKFINGRVVKDRPISLRETNNLFLNLNREQVPVGNSVYTLNPGVIYLKTNNPKVPYRATYTHKHTKETAEEIVTLIEAYNEYKTSEDPENHPLPDYFKEMNPTQFINYLYSYVFIPKNDPKVKWGITPVHPPKVGKKVFPANRVRLYNNVDKNPDGRYQDLLSREDMVNLLVGKYAAVNREYFEDALPFRPFSIQAGKVKVGPVVSFKVWYGDFRNSRARIDSVPNRNLAFEREDVRVLGNPIIEEGAPIEGLIESVSAPEIAPEKQPLSVDVTDPTGKLPNDIKEEFKGKLIYATPGAGKTTLSQKMQGVVDADLLIVEEMKKRHPEFFAESTESVQDFIFRYVKENNHKAEINATVLEQIKELNKQGYTVLTGTAKFISEADVVLTVTPDNPRIIQKFGNLANAESYSRGEQIELKSSNKEAISLTNTLEAFLTNQGFTETTPPDDTLPRKRKRGDRPKTNDQIFFERSKSYRNQITEAQNQAAKNWVESVAKKAFGADRFIFEHFATNPTAWATWSESGIRLFADANFAEAYHEAWHEFTQLYLSPEQRKALYKEAAKIYGKLTQKELEERLAEDFRQFMLTGVLPEAVQNYKEAKTVFQKIADFLKNLFSNKKTIDRYFENLAKGQVGKKVSKPDFVTLNSAKALSLYNREEKLENLSYEESKRYLDMMDELFVFVANNFAQAAERDELKKREEAGENINDFKPQTSFLTVLYNPANLKTVYDGILDYLEELEQKAEETEDSIALKEIDNLLGTDYNNFYQLVAYHKANSELFTSELLQAAKEIDELAEEELSDTNIVKDELGSKTQLEMAPPVVINLIKTLPLLDSQNQPITNALTGIPVFGDFTENWNIVKNVLSGSRDYPEMLERLEKLSNDYPQFEYLLNKLPKKIRLNADQQIRNEFFRIMSLEKVQGVQGSFNREGKYNISNTGTLDVKRIRDQWALRFNTEKGGKYKKTSSVTSNFVLDPTIFQDYSQAPKSPEDVLDFLQHIGFNYSQKTIEAFLEDFHKYVPLVESIYTKLKSATLTSGKEIADPFQAIRTEHFDKVAKTKVRSKMFDLDKLIELETIHNLSFSSDIIQSADGTRQVITTTPTYQTKIVAALNDAARYPYFEDLFTDFPELDPSKNWNLRNSAYLNYLFDFTSPRTVNGKLKHARRQYGKSHTSLSVVSLNGVTSEQEELFNKKTIDLLDPQKHLADIRSLLYRYGRVEENNRIADKSTTRGLRLDADDYFLYNEDFYFQEGKFAPKSDVWNIIYGYIEAEAKIVDKVSVDKNFNNNNKLVDGIPQLGYFSDILSPELRKHLYAFFKTQTLQDFESSPLRNQVKQEVTVWINKLSSASEELLSPFKDYKNKNKKTDLQTTFAELQMYHTISMIHRIEQYKLFNYHPYYYKNAKDVEKRIPTFNASGTFPILDKENLNFTEAFLATRTHYEKYVNAKLTGQGITSLPKNANKEHITYLVFEDTALDSQTARENKKDYGKHYHSYAETKKKVDVQDAASIISLDFFRKFYASSTGLSFEMKKELDRQASILENLIEVKINPQNEAARQQLLKDLNQKPYYIFSVKKLQYAGPGITDTELVPVFHKYANKVLLPSEMVASEELFNIGLKLHLSGADYAVQSTGTKIAETVKPVPLFYNGKVNITPQPTGVISLRYLKEQQEVEHKKDALIIFATQFRKLLFKDLTTEEENNLFKIYKAYINQIVGHDKANYFEKIEDKKKAVEFLVEELSKKNVSAITKDLIRLKESNQELEYVIDSLIERTMAEGALVSSLKKSIIRQKFHGTQFVQFPVSLIRPEKKLKFYRLEDGKVASAECVVAFSPKYYSLLDLPYDAKTTIGTFDENNEIVDRFKALTRLNQKLADPAFRKKHREALTLAGVRIPVQGYNSMEKMEIVEFLPEESGQIILVPDELVVKSGGDFDIDKLFMYQPYLKNGRLLTTENSSKKALEDLLKRPVPKTREEIEKGAALTKTTVKDYLKKTNFSIADIEEIRAYKGEKKRLQALVNLEERRILQNSLFKAIIERLSQKEIFEDLIEPNNVDDIDRLSKTAPAYLQSDFHKITKDPATGRNMWSNLINPLYQIYVYQLAHAVDMVGIAAKANTFQTAAQDVKLEIVDKEAIQYIYINVHKTPEGSIKLWGIYDVKGERKISQIISQVISGSVDVVKNDNILKINITPDTAPVALYLNQMGATIDDIVALVTEELVYKYSKGNSFASILETTKLFNDYAVYDKKQGFDPIKTAQKIMGDTNPEKLLTDTSDFGKLARLAQYVILEAQQLRYLTPLVIGVDYDTQSFQNFEDVTKKERDVRKVYESNFFNDSAIVKLTKEATTAPFRIETDFVGKFEELFPISASKKLINFILDSYKDKELNKKRIPYEKFSRRIKNAILVSLLESNMSEFKQYADLLKVVPEIPNLEDQFVEIKREAAEYDAYIPLLNEIFFVGNINSKYIAPGITKSDNEFDVDTKKEQFSKNLTWDAEKKHEVPEEFRQKVRNFFRNFAYAGIISTQLNKTHYSYLEIIPESIYTPVIDKHVRSLGDQLKAGDTSYLTKVLLRFKFNNPDLYPLAEDGVSNPSLRFYQNYNLNITTTEVREEYSPLVDLTQLNAFVELPTIEPSKSALSTISTGFQGYKGGFEDKGKGTPQGDGKDKAMREVADGFIGEIVKNNTSSQTSRNFIIDKSNKADKSQNAPTSAINIPLQGISGANIIMLARNSERKGAALTEETKYWIRNANLEGAEFVVGDMPGVDSQFIDYLQEIGAKFTIYHTGNVSRIQLSTSTQTVQSSFEEDIPGIIENEKIELDPKLRESAISLTDDFFDTDTNNRIIDDLNNKDDEDSICPPPKN